MRYTRLFLAASGLISFCFLCSDGYPQAVEPRYDTIYTGTPGTQFVALAVSNFGEIGQAGAGGVNMDFTACGLECGIRHADSVYLYSAAPYVIVADNAAGDNARLTCSYGQAASLKPYAWSPDGSRGAMLAGRGYGFDEFYDSLYAGQIVSVGNEIAMERTYYSMVADYQSIFRDFVFICTKLYSVDGQPHQHVTAGNVSDWNVPSDSINTNTSGVPLSEDFVYAQGTDTTLSTACQPNSHRFGAEAFVGSYTHAEWVVSNCVNNEGWYWGVMAHEQQLLHDTGLASDGVTIIDPPQPDARTWWEMIAANPETHSLDGSLDLAIWFTFVHDYSLAATDTLYFWTVMGVVRDGFPSDLEAQVSYARSQLMGQVRCCIPECASRCDGRVGDANGSGDDEPTIGDVSAMIDAKFIAGTCDGIILVWEADINQSGGYDPTCDDITIGDISMLIDYLFITGPNGMELPPCL